MILTTFKFLIIILSISSCLTIKFKLKNEKSILITFLGINLLIYILGLLNIMVFGLYISYILSFLSIVYIIYSIIKKKIDYKKILTLGTILYIVCSLTLAIVLKNTHFSAWDEFSHWGPNLKAMVNNDLFWSNSKWDGIHVVYQPLAGIMEYIFCKLNSGFSEDIAYFGMNISILTFIIPFIANKKINIKNIVISLLFILSVYCLIFAFNFSLTSIYIDLLLGICFSTGIYFSLNNKRNDDKIIVLLMAIALVMLKTTGILFSLIILLIIFCKNVLLPCIKEKRINKKSFTNVLKILMIVIVMLGFYKSWDLYCKSNNRFLDKRHDNNFISQINIKQFVSAILQRDSTEEKYLSIAKSFYSALNNENVVKLMGQFSIIQLFIIFNIILIMNSKFSKEEDKEKEKSIILAIAFSTGFLMYCLMLMITFMFAFTETEGRGLFSLDRYMSTFFIAFAINIVILFMNKKKKEYSIMIIILLICIYTSNIQTLLKPINKGKSNVPEYLQTKADIVTSNLNRSDKVYVIFQDPGYSVDPFVFRYCISPIVMNLMDEYSLGKLKSENDTLTYNISEKEWEQKLINENYDYVFILRSSNEFIEMYKDIFEDGVDLSNVEDKIFKVNKVNENEVKLQLYENEKQV